MNAQRGFASHQFPLAGTAVLVTGGNGGIGFGLAKAAAGAGADVAIWGRDAKKTELAVSRLREDGTEVFGLSCDVTDQCAVQDAFSATVHSLGRVDTCFANAGGGTTSASFLTLTTDEWRAGLSRNLDSAMFTLQVAARHMVDRDEGGSLVAISSLSAVHGGPRNLPYAVAKGAILSLMRAIAVDLAKHRIRANTIIAGFVDTELTAPVKQDQRRFDATIRRIPVGRWATPADLRSLAVFLAARDPIYHTGDEIVFDGGYTKF